MLVEFGKAGWVGKARQQPEKVRQVLDKVRTDGAVATYEAVRSKLQVPMPLGYSNAGVVTAIGEGVEGFQVGDRVVSNGPHAEWVCVPKNLCASIPDEVSFETAAFAVLGSIGLQGMRLAVPTFGERFVVFGLGVLGLIEVQLLRANGCRVLALDLNPERLAKARALGAEIVDLEGEADPVAAASRFSDGRGVDGAIITASSTSDEIVHQAAQMCRKRGRIVLVGVVGLQLRRADFYEKELSFQVSCSYGPGRYDDAYERLGHDYPLGFVRWTEQRNFEAVLQAMAQGSLRVEPLISHRYDFRDAPEAYSHLSADSGALGLILNYASPSGEAEDAQGTVSVRPTRVPRPSHSEELSVGFIGAGDYAHRVLMPAFQKAGCRLVTVASRRGLTAAIRGRIFGFEQASTDPQEVFNDPLIDVVVIATRHDTHADLVCRALKAGKHVFVEKPLALTNRELDEVLACYDNVGQGQVLTVGFNRRFSPHVKAIQARLEKLTGPKTLVATINAGAVPADHWAQTRDAGGGRIVGEGCHFVDLLRCLVGSKIERVQVAGMTTRRASSAPRDTATIVLEFEDGSVGTVHYFANGSKRFPKERVEVFSEGQVFQLDNFRTVRGWGNKRYPRFQTVRQDKGNQACVDAFVAALHEGREAIPVTELVEVSRATIRAAQLLEGSSAE